MAIKKGIIGTASITQDVFDPVENRINVAMHTGANIVSYEDVDFSSGDNNSVISVLSDLGVKGHTGYFANDGPGDIKLEFSYDGSTYGGVHTLHGGETLLLDGLNINKIKLTYVDNSAYRCLIG